MNYRPPSALAFALLVAACGKPAAAPDQSTGSSVSGMAMPAQVANGAKGVGTITEIDPAADKATFAHGPVQELHWPAMTMSFSAPPKLLDGFSIGDKVAFSFDWNGKSGRLVSIERR